MIAMAIGSATFAAESISPLGTYTPVESRHWSFRPRAHPEIPEFKDAADQKWATTPLDAFILARLKKEGLQPSQPADRATLIRRVYFDLVGLPPAPNEVALFVRNPSPGAWKGAFPPG